MKILPHLSPSRVSTTSPRISSSTSIRRWLILIVGSLLLHVLLITGWPRFDWSKPRNVGQPLVARLRAASPAPKQAASVVQPPLPQPNVKPVHKATPPQAQPQQEIPLEPSTTSMRSISKNEENAALKWVGERMPQQVPLATNTSASASAPIPTTAMPDPALQAASAALMRAIPPNSATLQYRVEATDPRKEPATVYYGYGTIAWKADRDHYALDLQARLNILFVSLSVLSSHSEGMIEESGLAPERYTETPRNKSTLSINFNHDERKSVTFSASTNSLPLMPGVQDRLSILLQVGAMVRANFDPMGNTTNKIEVAVAGTRGDISIWRFASLGKESLQTDAGAFQTLHLKRAPNNAEASTNNEQTMDLWVAIDATGSTGTSNAQGYPVKIRFTEANSSHYDLTLEKIE